MSSARVHRSPARMTKSGWDRSAADRAIYLPVTALLAGRRQAGFRAVFFSKYVGKREINVMEI